jgi:hypothetical protein
MTVGDVLGPPKNYSWILNSGDTRIGAKHPESHLRELDHVGLREASNYEPQTA